MAHVDARLLGRLFIGPNPRLVFLLDAVCGYVPMLSCAPRTTEPYCERCEKTLQLHGSAQRGHGLVQVGGASLDHAPDVGPQAHAFENGYSAAGGVSERNRLTA